MKTILFLLALGLFGIVAADSSSVLGVTASGGIKYGKWVDVTGNDGLVLCINVADTTASTAFSTDSAIVRWGLQRGVRAKFSRTSLKRDTVPEGLHWRADTLKNANYDTRTGFPVRDRSILLDASGGDFYSPHGVMDVDTTGNMATQCKDMTEYISYGASAWPMFRPWAEGLTGTAGDSLVVIFTWQWRDRK